MFRGGAQIRTPNPTSSVQSTNLVSTPCTVLLRSRDRLNRHSTRPGRCVVPVDTWRVACSPLVPVSRFSPTSTSDRSMAFRRATLLHFLPTSTRFLIEVEELQALLVLGAPMFDGTGTGRYALGRVSRSQARYPISQLTARLLDGRSCEDATGIGEWAMWLRLE